MDKANAYYTSQAPDRADVAALRGPTVLEFGTDWCGPCLAARPFVEQALAAAPGVRHLKIEDGPGRALGRAYRVKLWPTLLFLRDGVELARVVRPLGAELLQPADSLDEERGIAGRWFEDGVSRRPKRPVRDVPRDRLGREERSPRLATLRTVLRRPRALRYHITILAEAPDKDWFGARFLGEQPPGAPERAIVESNSRKLTAIANAQTAGGLPDRY